jgi:hypothetical protein
VTPERYLLDKSALARWPKPAVAPVLDELSDRGLLAVCGAVEIESNSRRSNGEGCAAGALVAARLRLAGDAR